MTNTEKQEWRRWWQFFIRRVREFLFLSAWVMMSWGLHYIVVAFPLEGTAKYMLHVFEGAFDIYTLREMLIMPFFPHELPFRNWLRKMSRVRRISKAQKRRRGQG